MGRRQPNRRQLGDQVQGRPHRPGGSGKWTITPPPSHFTGRPPCSREDRSTSTARVSARRPRPGRPGPRSAGGAHQVQEHHGRDPPGPAQPTARLQGAWISSTSCSIQASSCWRRSAASNPRSSRPARSSSPDRWAAQPGRPALIQTPQPELQQRHHLQLVLPDRLVRGHGANPIASKTPASTATGTPACWLTCREDRAKRTAHHRQTAASKNWCRLDG
jgi:hypothetical protein